MKTIRLDVCATGYIVHADNLSDVPKLRIQQQKQAIHGFRNSLLSQYLSHTLQPEDIVVTEFGKPYLKDFPDFSFNHSHSRQHYALASSHQVRDLGVDIEDLNRQVRFEALAGHAFHAEEIQLWQEYDCDSEYWFRIWTAKEAILKAAGLGIRMNLNELNVRLTSSMTGGVCSHDRLGVFAFQSYIVMGSMLTVAWRSELSCKGFNFPKIELIRHS